MPITKDTKDVTGILLSSENSWNLDSDNLNVFGIPELSITFADGNTSLHRSFQHEIINAHPLDIIEAYTRQGYLALGYISYDFLSYTDVGVKLRCRNFSRFPEVYFNLYKEQSVQLKDIFAVNCNKNDVHTLSGSEGNSDKISWLNQGQYEKGISRILDYIKNGDVYQVNLSELGTMGGSYKPLETFFNYYNIQPVPYAMYLDCTDFRLLSGSMELFLQKRGNTLRTRPIKGTRERDCDPEIDIRICDELSNNVKEKAENLMIVDLMRNDLSRICKTGSVEVEKLFDIRSYSTLHQMESTINGKLKDDISFKDIIYCVFPPGSVTGAPKKRSIEIIDELEGHYRGPYCGCAGIIKPNGDFTLSVSIRTAVMRNEEIYYWAGSGIVYDSDPGSEYLETLLKSRAFLSSII